VTTYSFPTELAGAVTSTHRIPPWSGATPRPVRLGWLAAAHRAVVVSGQMGSSA